MGDGGMMGGSGERRIEWSAWNELVWMVGVMDDGWMGGWMDGGLDGIGSGSSSRRRRSRMRSLYGGCFWVDTTTYEKKG